jgi:Mitochondrial calcium uniporter
MRNGYAGVTCAPLHRFTQVPLVQFNAMFGLGLTTGIGLYGYLSFVELNWDIMEPITYITGTGISLVGPFPRLCFTAIASLSAYPGCFRVAGFWFWLATASEFEYSNMYGAVLGWKLRSAYRKLAEASPTAKPRSKREFIEIDGALHPVKVPHNADQVAFESELKALEAQAEKLRDELDDLSVQA